MGTATTIQRKRGEVVVRGPGVYMRSSELGAGFIVQVYEGRATIESCRAGLDMMEAVIARGASLTFFIDSGRTTSYETGAREMFADWMKAHRGYITSTHMLVSNSLLQMAATLTNMSLGDKAMITYTDRAVFQRRFEAEMPTIDVSAALAVRDAGTRKSAR